MNTDTTLLKKVEELSARVVALETENRLLRQKLDHYIRHYFGGQHNEGLDKHQLELLLQGLPNVITLSRYLHQRPKPRPLRGMARHIRCDGCWLRKSWRRRRS
jgi:hypothetical protein